MEPTIATPKTPTRVELTRIPDSWAWMRPDILVRLLPFTAAFVVAWVWSGHARWLGLSAGDVPVQLIFAAVGVPFMFVASTTVQLWLTRRRGALLVPADARDAWFQATFYAANGPIEEAFFRGLVQGGASLVLGAPLAFAIATTAYVLYHKLGRWTWPDTLATALVGIPLGLAFWLLPGPPSLLGVALAHIAATCGFLGPGPYLLKRWRLV